MRTHDPRAEVKGLDREAKEGYFRPSEPRERAHRCVRWWEGHRTLNPSHTCVHSDNARQDGIICIAFVQNAFKFAFAFLQN